MERNPQNWELPFQIGFLYTPSSGTAEAAHYWSWRAGSRRSQERAAVLRPLYSPRRYTETSIRMGKSARRGATVLREMATRYLKKLRRVKPRREAWFAAGADSSATRREQGR
jgi:hypothetical protein